MINKILEQHGVWLAQIAVLLIGAQIVRVVGKHAIQKLIAALDPVKNYWQRALFDSMARGLPLLVWIFALSFALEIAWKNTGLDVLEIFKPMRHIGIMAVIAWVLFGFSREVSDGFVTTRHDAGVEVDRTTVDALRKLVQMLIIVIATLIAMQSLGFSITGVMAIGGVGGIVVGLAAKDLLANFFGGLMIYLDRPFQVGDTIRSPDRNIEGSVEKVGWRLTTIITPDKRPLYVPNATFMSITVENPSRMTHRRINEFIAVRYQDVDKLPGILKDIQAYLNEFTPIDKKEKILAHLARFSASSVDVEISCFVAEKKGVEFVDVKQAVLFKILQIIWAHGADIAFATTVVRANEPLAVLVKPD